MHLYLMNKGKQIVVSIRIILGNPLKRSLCWQMELEKRLESLIDVEEHIETFG